MFFNNHYWPFPPWEFNTSLKTKKQKTPNNPPAPQKAAFVFKMKYMMQLSCWNADYTAEIKPEYDLKY